MRGARADREVRIPSWKRLQSLCPGHRGKVKSSRLMAIVESGAAAVEFRKSIERDSGHERSIAIRIGDGAPVHTGRCRFCVGSRSDSTQRQDQT